MQFLHFAWPWTPNQADPLWLSRPCRSRCHVACCWLQPAFRGFPTRMVYLCYIPCFRYTILVGNPRFVFLHWPFQSAIHGCTCLGSLAAESRSRAQTRMGGFFQFLTCLSSVRAAHVLDWLFCLTHPWLASCQSTPLFFFDSIMAWILGILHCIEKRLELLHFMSCFHCWQVQ